VLSLFPSGICEGEDSQRHHSILRLLLIASVFDLSGADDSGTSSKMLPYSSLSRLSLSSRERPET